MEEERGGGHISLAQSQASASLDFLILSLVVERRPSLDSLQKSVTDGAAAAIFSQLFFLKSYFFKDFSRSFRVDNLGRRFVLN